MEVGKIAINDENFSSKNQKNTSTNSANEQDVRIFKKHVTHESTEDVSADLSDTSEDAIQDLGSLFRKLKLSDEKEQSQSQSNDTDAQENPQNVFYFKISKKESNVQHKKAPETSAQLYEDVTKVPKDSLSKDLVTNDNLPNKTFSDDSTKNLIKASDDNFNKGFTKQDLNKLSYKV